MLLDKAGYDNNVDGSMNISNRAISHLLLAVMISKKTTGKVKKNHLHRLFAIGQSVTQQNIYLIEQQIRD